MISVAAERAFDLVDVIRRSPVAEAPDADRVMLECIRRSAQVFVGRLDGEVACVWGLIPPTLLSDTAYLWLLTTDIVAMHKFLFIRHSQLFIEEALREYACLIGDVIIGNAPAKRWLEWLGAEFSVPVGGRIPFTIRRKVDG